MLDDRVEIHEPESQMTGCYLAYATDMLGDRYCYSQMNLITMKKMFC